MSHLLVGAAVVSTILMVGCSADVEVDNSKRARPESSKDEKVDPAEAKRRAEADALEAKRDAEEASYSATNAAPLYVTKPMAWFKSRSRVRPYPYSTSAQ